MAEGSDSAAISCNSAESLKREEGQIKDSAMAVDGGGSCAAKEAGSVAPCSEKDVSASAAVLERAEALKNEGNVLFKQHQYAEAVAKYSAAIDLVDEAPVDPRETQLHVFLCNRAFAHLRMENFGSAIIDAERALKLNPKFSKGYYRRGTGYFCLGNLKAAQHFERVCQLRGGKDADAQSRLNECKKQLRAQAFAAAIRTKQTIPASKQVLAEGLEKLFPVPEDYAGPVYKKGKVDQEFLQALRTWLQNPENRLHPQYAYAMAVDFIEILEPLPSLVDLEIPEDKEITICGDVHGQFYDLLNIFTINGMPSEENPYLFNGDIVDRGSFSVEVLLMMVACKLAYPNHMHITRGNHETSEMNAMYGFKGEMLNKYDERLYQIFSEAFRLLPLAFVVNKKAFVVHGGLSRQENVTLDDIRKIDRNREPGSDVLITDLLWSDPSPLPGLTPSKRGVACQFGPDITEKFLKTNNLSFVIRSHEMKEAGYEVEHGGKLITVFSAPNYCDEMGNKGAFIRLKGSEMVPKFHQFTAVPHPPGPAMQYANPMLSFI
ncbi:serine/threonine protein phosphatase, putative [Eimeria necatrix]|uniref:Serine/threonine-protein phosphatase T n=1 Tax=Eimeria necatrix TaxID=51315 RepID=U6MQ16_9EIME|nr:serine/threonine protein phosphatase, putative [Eimeria necatrix]CDJ66091.1 serine/threonine protein phosphatase, putative [Eimeria necatrix]